MKQNPLFVILIVLAGSLLSCTASRHNFDPHKKYGPNQLKKDFLVFRTILEKDHPSIYWFTPRDSMDYFFDQALLQLNDSLTEPAFRNILSYVAEKIHCGHTSVQFSRQYTHYLDTAFRPVFPLSLKVWSDSMAVVANLIQQDSLLKPGVVIHSINGWNSRSIIDSMQQYVVSDGRNLTGKWQSMSMRGSFGALFSNIYGLTDSFDIGYSNLSSIINYTRIPVYRPVRDTTEHKKAEKKSKEKELPRYLELNQARNVQIDTTLSSAYLTLNTFSRGNRLRSFFRKSFRVMNEHHIKNLVVDVRSNGGGDAGLSTLLTAYLADKKFKLADSLYTNRRSLSYARYISKSKLYWAASLLVTRKRNDGHFHFGYFERHYFKPRKKHHFNGHIYIITGGNSFSATTLFTKILQGQKNVLVVGEETGGGSYGNTAWMIPEATLPETHLRFRLPRFRLVMDPAALLSARGIIPDIEISPTAETIRRGIDPKAALVREIIVRRNSLSAQ